MIDLYLACVKLGVIFVPINILYRDREISHILSDAEPKLLVTERDLPQLAAEAGETPAFPAPRRRRARRAGLHLRHHRSVEGRDPHPQQFRGERGESAHVLADHRSRSLPAGAAAVSRPRARQRPALLADVGLPHAPAGTLRSPDRRRRSFWISVRRCSSACRPCTSGCSKRRAEAAREIGEAHAPVRLRLGAAAGAGARGFPRRCSATPFSNATA